MYNISIVQHKMMSPTMLLLVVATLLQTANIDAFTSGETEPTPITENTTFYPKEEYNNSYLEENDLLYPDSEKPIYMGMEKTLVEKALSMEKTLAYLNTTEDQSIRRAIEIHLSHCPYNDICNFSLGLETKRYPNCTQCRCDVDCKRECCPNFVKNLDELAITDANELECRYPTLHPPQINTNDFEYCKNRYSGYYFITECPPGHDMEVRKACRSLGNMYVISKEFDFSNVTPVTDIRSRLNYWNKFCASCHGIAKENLLAWDVSLNCSHSIHFDSSLKQTVIDAINTKKCDITFQPPTLSEYKAEKCKPLISSCNQTGYSSQYDEVIERLCHSPLGSSFDFVYKNVFCMICNNETKHHVFDICPSGGFIGDKLPFSYLLNFRSQEQERPEMPQCSIEMVFDLYLRECRQLYCSPTKILHEGKCVNIFSQIKVACFEAEITFFPLERCPITQAKEVAKTIGIWFEGLLSYWIYSKYKLCTLDTAYEVNNNNTIVKDDYIRRNSQQFNSNVTFISSKWKFKVNGFYEFDRVFEMMRNITNSTVSFQLGNNTNITLLPRLTRVFDIANLSESLSTNMCDEVDVLQSFWTNMDPICSNTWHPSISLPLLIPCTMIELDEQLFNWSYTEYGVYVPKLNLSLNMTDFNVVNKPMGSALRICTHVYMYAVEREKFKRDVSEYISFEADAILSVVCTSVSLICLLLTLIVYIVFPELQTVPGKLSMLLVINLFMAQVMYIVFVFTPNSTGFICKAVGVLLHFFWLSAIFWMHLCTVHMLKVFVKLNKPNSKTSISKTIIINTVIVIAASVIFVLTNVIKALIESDMVEMGYGRKICYISSGRMIGFTIALPVGFVVVSNLVMFLVVIYKFRSLPSVEMNAKHNRNNIVILAKLSSLTGITWIFGFLYVWTEEIALSYFFIVLNSSVGIFIMASFILNKRVITLIRNKFSNQSTMTNGSDQ